MNKLSAIAAVVALTSFNLVACAEPNGTDEPAGASESEIASAAGAERFVETNQPARFTDAFPADRADLKTGAMVDTSLDADPIAPDFKTGAMVDTNLDADPIAPDFKTGAMVDANLDPAPISPEQRAGVELTPPVAEEGPRGIDRTSAVVDACKGTYVCKTGLAALHRDGSRCMFGNIVLSADWTARYEDQPAVTGTWRADAKYIDVSFGDAFKTRCERKD
ncbi:MAG: hypothetical protein KF764_25860 [Labilithrix sp.]|nr:hypothetical protein [Labilithrix sp.]